ncbi:MAG: XTP/dITP diphosphatase [bacterium]|nr:XTP/dITP diphosphatase [bacterium]
MKIVLATKNQDKVKEIKQLLKDIAVEVFTLDHFPEIDEIIEDGVTLEQNAIKKAKTVFHRTGLIAVADDTGLEVDALAGKPGVFSSRFAGEDATYEDNVRKLLQQMEGISQSKRGARFRCVISIVGPGIAQSVDGVCSGMITRQKRGVAGFGYDPVFWVAEYGQTFAEMPLELKNRISHRGLALQKAKKVLQQLAANQQQDISYQRR